MSYNIGFGINQFFDFKSETNKSRYSSDYEKGKSIQAQIVFNELKINQLNPKFGFGLNYTTGQLLIINSQYAGNRLQTKQLTLIILIKEKTSTLLFSLTSH